MIKTPTVNTKEFFIKSSEDTFIAEERKQLLAQIAQSVKPMYNQDKVVRLNFICTHNSRRSQLGQIWSHIAAEYFDLNIHSYSGGTEVTAFHKNTVKTLQEVVFVFKIAEFSHQNPVYTISFENAKKSAIGFSKTFDHPINETPFIAITTCNNADENCPFIPEASKRFHLPYIDPKFSDGTEECQKTYLATNKQVAAEMFYIFSTLKEELSN